MSVLLKAALDWVVNLPPFRCENDDPSATVLTPFPRQLQLDRHTCAVQTVRSVLAFFGHYASHHQVRCELETTRKNGTSIDEVEGLLERKGLCVRFYAGSNLNVIRRAIRNNCPVIALVDTDHMAAIFGYGKDSFYMMEPSLRRLIGTRISTNAFVSRWDREALVVSGG